MKVLQSADWHIGKFKGPTEEGMNLRFIDTIECLTYMVEQARKINPDIVCVSGDIFHQEQVGPERYSDEMLAAVDILEGLAECSKCVVVMRGTTNHDGKNQFRVLEKMLEHNKKVVVVTKPMVISTPVADVACIPGFDKQEFRTNFPGLSADEENQVWTEQISNLVIGLRGQCRTEVPALLMAHYTVPGCNMESGQTSFFTNFEPVIPREALDAAHYEGVFLGHIHRPQQLFGLNNVFYSGAVNALNFNDEGQRRGFFIHEFSGKERINSQFVTTPYRNFMTIEWGIDEVADYLRDGIMYLTASNLPQLVVDSIVRVKYYCTSEQKKMLNVPQLQKQLYDLGAFYVTDPVSERAVDFSNRGLLSEESDPLVNLKKWLDEKCYKEPDKIVELAEPIIASAIGNSSTAEIHGVFRPISIKVKNYRNYKEEQFDFADISFCTINGVNGAGKSSLFMDAIVDCLFEETREGDIKAWIRGTEDARSGSIEFIFEIGADRFRVVRTRVKSGKATLNLSRMNGAGDWMNLSKERMIDTQEEINKVLGMDSMTFRSCALIMQDQYGLFLQARKEERIAILGNLLGLGIYNIMELDARKHLGDAKRALMAKKEAVKIKEDIIQEKGNPESELERINEHISQGEETMRTHAVEREKLVVELSSYESALKAKNLLEAEIHSLEHEKISVRENVESTKKIITACDTMLKGADDIRRKSEEYNAASQLLMTLDKEMVVYENAKQKCTEYAEQERRYQNIIDTNNFRNRQIEEELTAMANSSYPNMEEKLKELEAAKQRLEVVRDLEYKQNMLSQEISQRRAVHTEEIADLQGKERLLSASLEEYLKQKEFMENSGCPDMEHASCRFLEKAVSDVAKIPDTEATIKIYRQSIEEREQDFAEWLQSMAEKKTENGFSEDEKKDLLLKITELGVYERQKKAEEERKLYMARLEAEKASNDKTIAQCEENLSLVKLQAQEANETLEGLSDIVRKYQETKEKCESLKVYTEQEQKLPVYEERKSNAVEKLNGLEKQLDIIEEKILIKTVDLIDASEKLSATNATAKEQIDRMDAFIHGTREMVNRLQIEKGTLMQKVEDIHKMQAEIKDLKHEIEKAAELANRYEALKQAFSQDGVPHQIIRNIVPYITDTANNILGSMTGGTMGVEFVMERTVKGKDGDKATLDVLINEYGKTTLPYASKSGGEKVKASLAVILALAEIKTTAAGIQLGMLFIDEAPFLDSDGTQAYCDALETIRNRYPDTKVMAITHDNEFKSRFPQSITIIKDENGSHVQWGM